MDLERDLRATLTDDRLSLPVRPDAVSLVQSGVRRRRRNRAVATVSAAVVLVTGGVAAVALATGHGSQQQRIVEPVDSATPTLPAKPTLPPPSQEEVRWTGDAYDYHQPPAFPGAVADPSVAWCRADQLALSQSFQGATGSVAGVVVVANTSPATCALQGQPAVRVEAADGATLVASVPEPFYVDEWVRLQPGAASSAPVQWMQQYCGRAAPARIAIDLPHGGGALSAPFTGRPACDSVVPTTSHLVVDGFVSRPGTPFTPLAGLQGRIDGATTTVAPGAVVNYRLHLQSMDAPSVSLNPCLPYRERLVDHTTQRVLIEEDHLLNCGDAPQITDPQSNHDVVFDMRLVVPASAPAGDYDLVWQSVLKPVSAGLDQLVHVTPPVPACRDGQLQATIGRGGAATGHYGLDIVFRNISASPCALRGYPGVRLLDAAGRAMTPTPRRGSAFVFTDPGPSTVVLAARTGVASFAIGGDDYDNVHQRECPSARRIAIFAPDTRGQLLVDSGFPDCPGGVTFSAVVAGTDGPQN